MALDDFEDVLRALRDHPQWQEDLRRIVLTDRLLALPDIVAELAEAQARTQAQVSQLAQRVDQLTEQVRRLAEQGQALTQRLDRIATQVEALTQQMSKVVSRLDRKLDPLWGEMIERRYRDRAAAYFAPIARRIKVLSHRELDDLMTDAVAQGRLPPQLAREVQWADAVARGRREDEEVFLVVEAAGVVDDGDIERVVRRAGYLARATGAQTFAIVAGESIVPETVLLAKEQGVWQVTDGEVVAPAAA